MIKLNPFFIGHLYTVAIRKQQTWESNTHENTLLSTKTSMLVNTVLIELQLTIINNSGLIG